MTVFNHLDYWLSLGLNVATYKPALAKVLVTAANEGIKEIKWEDLSRRFLNEYKSRIEANVCRSKVTQEEKQNWKE